MIRESMIDNNCNLSITKQTNLLNINRTSLYYHQKTKDDDTTIANQIHDIWLLKPFYGYRRITADLNRMGYEINHKKVQRLINEMDICGLPPKNRTRYYEFVLKEKGNQNDTKNNKIYRRL